MRTASAQLPKGGGEDRVYTTAEAVILLDGASAFRPAPVTPGAYVDALGAHVLARVSSADDLRVILRDAIAATVRELELTPGNSPSSTVAIVRMTGDDVECLVLGDSLIVLPGQSVTDNRLDQVSRPQRERYLDRLKAGHGYDQEHRDLLRQLQTEQARQRNQPGGYWIAESDPVAADHAVTGRRPLPSTPWAVLASDGAYAPMSHLGLADWPDLQTADPEKLARILGECQKWEDEVDPHGIECPRAKQHDDKSLAVAKLSP